MNFAYGVQRKSDEEHLKSNKFSGFSTQKILFPLRCEIFSGTFRQRNNWVWLQNKNFCVTNTDLHLVVKCFQFSPPIITKGFNQMKKKNIWIGLASNLGDWAFRKVMSVFYYNIHKTKWNCSAGNWKVNVSKRKHSSVTRVICLKKIDLLHCWLLPHTLEG